MLRSDITALNHESDVCRPRCSAKRYMASVTAIPAVPGLPSSYHDGHRNRRCRWLELLSLATPPCLSPPLPAVAAVGLYPGTQGASLAQIASPETGRPSIRIAL